MNILVRPEWTQVEFWRWTNVTWEKGQNGVLDIAATRSLTHTHTLSLYKTISHWPSKHNVYWIRVFGISRPQRNDCIFSQLAKNIPLLHSAINWCTCLLYTSFLLLQFPPALVTSTYLLATEVYGLWCILSAGIKKQTSMQAWEAFV